MPTLTSDPDDDFERNKERLMDLLAAIENGRDAKMRSGLLPARERDELSLGVTALRDAIESYLACSGHLHQSLDDMDKGALVKMLGCCTRILAAGGMVSRHLGLPTLGDHRMVNKLRAKPFHGGKRKAMRDRAEKVRSTIENAERKPGEARKFKHPGDVLIEVRKLLKSPQLDPKTLNAYREFIDQNGRIDSPPAEQ